MNLRAMGDLEMQPSGFATTIGLSSFPARNVWINPHRLQVNGLACYKLQGEPEVDVRLNGADGFDGPGNGMPMRFRFCSRQNNPSFLSRFGYMEQQQAIKSKLKVPGL